MRKLKLTLDNLAVESFDAQGVQPPARGTVEANSATCHAAWSCDGTCSNGTNCPFAECATDLNTCQGSCWDVMYASECGASCIEVC